MTELKYSLSKIKIILNTKRNKYLRYKDNLHFFEVLKKKYAEGRIDAYEKAIKEIEKRQQRGNSE